MIRFIGDVHGKFAQYENIIADCEYSIQVGDFGLGFGNSHGENLITTKMKKGVHSFIRGNHDNPESCKRHPYFLRDGSIADGMMFIGGASSIDRAWRTEGVDWWNDEELTYSVLSACVDMAREANPKVMVTHTCPHFIPHFMGMKIFEGQEMRTEKALSAIFEDARPELWIFGHWHKSFDQTIDGTRFICLNELEYIDLEI